MAITASVRPRCTAYHVAGDPNGLVYDHYTDTLYVADARGGSILAIDASRQLRVARIESAGIVSAQRISGLTITPYGTLFVSRLGHGRAGGVFRIEPDGQPEPIAGIDARFWRLGLHYDPNQHVVYSTQFLKSRSGPSDGSVLEIDLTDGYVSTTASGFAKPVGVTRVGDSLVVTDAARGAVIRVDLVNGRAGTRSVITDRIGRPDSICACSGSSVLVTAYDRDAQIGTVYRLWLDGRAELITRGEWEPRGVATDGERAFIALRRMSTVLVVPVR